MKNELYIDNVPVDIDEKTNITLNYRSNFFTDVSKIVSNNTYSIKLPMTVHNCKVINEAHLPACVTNYPYINHKGRYMRNGVEIIPDASASIVEVADTIDIALAWGNISKFASIASGNKKLTDLDYGLKAYTDYIVWRKLGDNTVQFPRIDYGFRAGEENVWYHPAVTVKWILDKIQESGGIKFNIPADINKELQHCIMPLLTRNDAPKQVEAYMGKSTITGIGQYFLAKPGGAGEYAQINWSNFTNYYGSMLSYEHEEGRYYPYFANSVMSVSGHIVLRFTPRNGEVLGVTKLVCLGNDSSTTLFEVEYADMEYLSDGSYKVIYDFSDKEVILDETFSTEDRYIRFFIMYNGRLSSHFDISVYGFDDEVQIRSKVREVNLYGNYYFVPNLPDIKQIDFIKTVAAMFGLFALPGNDNSVNFIHVDDVIANKDKAYNWTKKVVASYPQNRPKTTNYSLDDFAQHNVYRWKDDDEDKYSGEIVIESEVMEYERDAFTAPFAPSEKRRGVAYIPLYSYSNEGELDYNSSMTPRILRLDGVQASFDGLGWGTLLQKYYKSFQKVLKNPHVITELIEISDIELKALDMSIPCYLGQYGKFYAIISIKAEKTGICECKLYQLN